MIRTSLCLTLALHLVPVQTQPDEHPIEQELGRCLDRNDTTVGMRDCIGAAYQRWDAELNAVYRELMANLPPAAKAQLRDAQRKWLAFRDAEFETIDHIYGSRQGTLWSLNMAGARLELLRQRVEDLIDHRDILFLDR